MLYLFDRCYRKGDPRMMHVGRTVVPQVVPDYSLRSTVLRPCLISMVVLPVCKYT